MKYLALLRGVNVGGKAAVSMAKLKEAYEKAGFTNVLTYINSGNVIFESEKNVQLVTKEVEALLEKTFFKIDAVVLSHKDLQDVVKNIPTTWKKDDLRKYVTFLKSSATPEQFIEQAQLKEGVDFIDKGPGVVYLSTKLEGITKTNFPKLAAKPVYKLITMRNFTTVEKLLDLMANNK